MKKRLTAMLLAMVLLSMTFAVGAAGTEGTGFTDVPKGSFYYDAVNWAVEQGITTGMGGGLFEPNVLCNRAQVVTFLWRLDGKPAVSGKTTFPDVEKGAFYCDAVQWAVKNEITTGTGDGLFQPNTLCNRAQVVTFLWRYAGKPSSDARNPFTDVDDGAWYAEAVKWAVEQGITTGLDNKTFGPSVPCNRAQVVTFLQRYAGTVTEEPEPSEPDWGIGDEDF